MLLIISPTSVQAADYLFAFMGGNARADLWLVDRSTGQVLLTETADTKTVAENIGHSGNIAFHHFSDTDQHAGWLADHLIRQALPKLQKMEKEEQLDVTSLSFFYALAGLDAVYKQADDNSGQLALRSFEQTVEATFQSDNRTLNAIYGVGDSALILRAINTITETSAHKKADVAVYADTYSIGFWGSDAGLLIQECFAENSAKTPAGGFFQLGSNGRQILFGENADGSLAEAVRRFWEKQGQHYTDTELQQRYQNSNNNELGGVLAELGSNAANWQLSEADLSTLNELVLATTQDIGKMLSEISPAAPGQKKPVIIIGFYADTLSATPEFYQALTNGLTNRYDPILIHGNELSLVLAGAAVQTFNEVETIMIQEKQRSVLLDAVKKASTQWQEAFNRSDAAGCAAQYETDAVMHARPFGTYTGTDEIHAFWLKLIDDGFADVAYINPKIEVLDEKSAIIRAGWTMNNAKGIIHKELWVLQPDGTAKLREDDFEVTP